MIWNCVASFIKKKNMNRTGIYRTFSSVAKYSVKPLPFVKPPTNEERIIRPVYDDKCVDCIHYDKGICKKFTDQFNNKIPASLAREQRGLCGPSGKYYSPKTEPDANVKTHAIIFFGSMGISFIWFSLFLH
jgi:hypothetical protein